MTHIHVGRDVCRAVGCVPSHSYVEFIASLELDSQSQAARAKLVLMRTHEICLKQRATVSRSLAERVFGRARGRKWPLGPLQFLLVLAMCCVLGCTNAAFRADVARTCRAWLRDLRKLVLFATFTALRDAYIFLDKAFTFFNPLILCACLVLLDPRATLLQIRAAKMVAYLAVADFHFGDPYLCTMASYILGDCMRPCSLVAML